MKKRIVSTLFGLGLFFASCTTAYKTEQTPDDVYFSPAKPATEPVDLVQDQSQRDLYDNYATNMDDQYLHMKVGNYYRWSMLDDYSYWNDSRYDFSYYNYYSSLGFNTYSNFGRPLWNIGFGWGTYFNKPIYSWGNPYYTLVTYYHPTVSLGNASLSGISAYRNKTYSNSNLFNNVKTGINNSNAVPASNFSTLVKRVFSSNGSTDTYDRAIRTFDNTGSSYRSSSNTSNYSSSSSNAGGNSGGVKSTGSSASGGRTTRN